MHGKQNGRMVEVFYERHDGSGTSIDAQGFCWSDGDQGHAEDITAIIMGNNGDEVGREHDLSEDELTDLGDVLWEEFYSQVKCATPECSNHRVVDDRCKTCHNARADLMREMGRAA